MAKAKKVKTKVENSTASSVAPPTPTPITEKLKGTQIIIGLGLGGLKAEKEYSVGADTAEVLINKGFATLKNN